MDSLLGDIISYLLIYLSFTIDKSPFTITRTCDYVECEPAKVWSDWSAQCGDMKRSRVINVVQKSVRKESCDGLQTTCPKTEDVESKQELCTCSIIECSWAPWSVWSSTCGDMSRERKIVGKLTSVKKLSCEGLKKTCTEKPQIEDRRFTCPVVNNNNANECQVKYRSLGCFHDDQINPRPLPELILTERDSSHRSWNKRLINWKQWNSYHVGFICRCAAKAKELKYRFFSAQFFGECWSGPEAGDTYFRNGEKDYKHCISNLNGNKPGFKQCQPGQLNCVGKKETNYVFKLD